MQHEERIRRRAHEIWQREGQPEGRHQDHWDQACREIAEESARDDAAARPASKGSAPSKTATAKPPPRPRRASGSAPKGPAA